jgi:hypothetical protein
MNYTSSMHLHSRRKPPCWHCHFHGWHLLASFNLNFDLCHGPSLARWPPATAAGCCAHYTGRVPHGVDAAAGEPGATLPLGLRRRGTAASS